MRKTTQKGYAILFTVVVISVISVIALGLADAAYRQLILSSVAKDSETAFYQSDTAAECGIYADNQTTIPTNLGITSWNCGVDKTGANLSYTISTPTGNRSDGYKLDRTVAVLTDPCFNITITKTTGLPVVTTLVGRGYSACNLSALRTVERATQAVY